MARHRAITFLLTLVLTASATGCTVATFEKPDGTKVYLSSFLKDTQIAEVEAYGTKDGESLKLKGYDGKARIEALIKLLEAAK